MSDRFCLLNIIESIEKIEDYSNEFQPTFNS